MENGSSRWRKMGSGRSTTPSPSPRGRDDDSNSFSDASVKGSFEHDDPPHPKLLKSQTRKTVKSEEYRQVFNLPLEEVLIQDFNCALQKKILLQGRMYIFERYIGFYSNIFGFEKKKVIPIKDITSLHKAKTAGLFSNAIEIYYFGKKSFFASFLSRDEAFRKIEEKWRTYSEHERIFFGRQASCILQDSTAAAISDSTSEIRTCEEPIDEESENPAVIVNDGDNNIEVADIATNTMILETEEDTPKLPKQYRTIMECKFPMDTLSFFKMFLSDEAVDFAASVHRKCNDEEFHCSRWEKHNQFGNVRYVSFRHPFNFYFGVKAASCQEVQCYRMYRSSHLILETSEQMNDIPYGDCFRVEARWDVKNTTEEGDISCFVCISLDIPFSKKTIWKGKIEQGAYDQCKKVYSSWIEEANLLLFRKRAFENEIVDTEECDPKDGNSSSDGNKAILGNSIDIQTSRITRNNSKKYTKGKRMDGISKPIEKSTTFPSEKPVETSRVKLRRLASEVLNTFLAPTGFHKHRTRRHEVRNFDMVKLLVFASVVTFLLLTQVGVMITLTRFSKARNNYSASSQMGDILRRNKMCHLGEENLVGLCYEKHIQFLLEEVAITEAWMCSLQSDLSSLKTHMQILHINNGEHEIREKYTTP